MSAPAIADDEPLGPAARRDLYALAARVFAAEADEALLAQLGSVQVAAGEPTGFVFVEPDLAARGPVHAVEELAVEYCRLFIGPQPVCAPYASAARGEALMGGRARTRLEDFMQRHAIELADGARIASPDHVAIELSLLAELCDELASDPTDAAEVLAAIRELLRDHVLPWVPDFLERIERETTRALYRATAQLVALVLAEERALHGLG